LGKILYLLFHVWAEISLQTRKGTLTAGF
jgi:hypothetical protein